MSAAITTAIAITSLIEHQDCASFEDQVEVVHHMMVGRKREFIAVCKDRKVVGMVSQKRLGAILGHRFGMALFGNRTIGNFLEEDALVFAESTNLQVILKQVFSRAPHSVFDDIVVVNARRDLVGLVPANKLVSVQNLMLQEHLTQAKQHEAEQRSKNRELEALTTKLNEANIDLARANAEAMEATKLKSQFLANMSHEIRTPMNSILGMTQLLLESALTQDQLMLASTVNESAESLLRIINDILDFSKIEAGKLDIHPERFNLVETIESSAQLMAERAFEKGLEIVVDLEPGTPEFVEGDGQRIRQILINLLGNAVKFTDKGHVRLSSTVLEMSPSSCRIRIEVEDTGCGIPGEVGDQLFQPFRQVDNSNTRRHGGTGLGLSITQNLVELMGGAICYTSELGKGSTFFFELPFSIDSTGTSHATEKVASDFETCVLIDANPCSRRAWGQVLSTNFKSVLESEHLRTIEEVMDHLPQDQIVLVVVLPNLPELEESWLEHLAGYRTKQVKTMVARAPGVSTERKLRSFLPGAILLSKPLRRTEVFRALNGTHKNSVGEMNGSSKPSTLSSRNQNNGAGDEPRTVLIVEDIETNRKVLQIMLKTLGCSVHSASNGIEALERMSELDFDIILMDCQMPEMDGFECTRRIRAGESGRNPSDIPIVAMTANAMRGDRERCLDAGMTDYMSKPVRKAELADMIRKSIREQPANTE